MEKKKNKLTIGIIAYVDSGKTTLTEKIMEELGIISDGAFLDYNTMEKNRKITIFSKECYFERDNGIFYLIDTPGHKDLFLETERSLGILDLAIFLLPAREKITKGSKFLFKKLRESNIPTIIFINKIDMENLFLQEINYELKELSDGKAISLEDVNKIEYKTFSEELALSSETAFDSLVENGYILKEDIAKLFFKGDFYPIMKGSALKGKGVDKLIDLLDFFAKYKGATVEKAKKAIVYKIDRQKNIRLTHIKVISGAYKIKDSFGNEKIEEIRRYNGSGYTNLDVCGEGDVVALVGLKNTYAGQVIGCDNEEKKNREEREERAVRYQVFSKENKKTFMDNLKLLDEIFPELNFKIEVDKFTINILGNIHREIIEDYYRENFGAYIEILPIFTDYMETIENEITLPISFTKDIMPYINLTLKPKEDLGRADVRCNFRSNQISEESEKVIESHLLESLNGQLKGVILGKNLVSLGISLSSGRGDMSKFSLGDIEGAIIEAIKKGMFLANPLLVEKVIKIKFEEELSSYEPLTSLIRENKIGKYVESFYTKTFTLELDLNERELLALDEALDISGLGYRYKMCRTFVRRVDLEKLEGFDFDLWEERLREIREEEIISRDEKKMEGTPVSVSLDEIFKKTFRKDNSKVKKYRVKKKVIDYDSSSGNKSKFNFSGQPLLLVDGYNMIFSFEELKKMKDVTISGAREALVERLENYCVYKGIKGILVFDAYKTGRSQVSTKENNNLTVVYTKEDETADSFIEQFVYNNREKYSITVATSDRLEQMNVYAQGAMRMSALELEERLTQTEEEIRGKLGDKSSRN